MNVIRGLAWLLSLQALGEILVRTLHLPWPGPVMGLGLMFLALHAAPVRDAVAPAARTLLDHLSLLFVPVGVGVITHADVLGRHGAALLAAILLSTWIGLATTALVLQRLLRKLPEESGRA